MNYLIVPGFNISPPNVEFDVAGGNSIKRCQTIKLRNLLAARPNDSYWGGVGDEPALTKGRLFSQLTVESENFFVESETSFPLSQQACVATSEETPSRTYGTPFH